MPHYNLILLDFELNRLILFVLSSLKASNYFTTKVPHRTCFPFKFEVSRFENWTDYPEANKVL